MERVQTKLRRGEQGFTLVELAIVMIIIGLLITGILKGQEMIANAQVTSTVAEIKGIDAAFSTFIDTFNSPPGDMVNPAVRLPIICTLTCVAVGNGDGRVSTTNFTTFDPGAVVAGEGLAAFMQMGAIDLIAGVNPTPQDTTVNVNDEVPAASISGASFRTGFTAGLPATGTTAALGGATATWRSGHYLVISGVPSLAVGTGAGVEGLTPLQATRIDEKLDDGLPTSGILRGGGAGSCVAGGNYDVRNVNSADCSVFVRIQG